MGQPLEEGQWLNNLGHDVRNLGFEGLLIEKAKDRTE